MSGKVTGRVILTALLLVTFLLGASALAADAPPPLPAAYWGKVTYTNGTPVASGTVEALVDGTVCGTISISNGFYGGPGGGDLKLVVQGAGLQNGKTVRFRVNGVEAAETVAWQSGDIQQVDLTVPPPSSGSQPGGTPGGSPASTPGGTSGGGTPAQAGPVITGPQVDRSSIEQALAANPGAPAITLSAAVEGPRAELVMAADALQALQAAGKGVVVQAGAVTVELPAAMLARLDPTALRQLAGTAEGAAVRLQAVTEAAGQVASYLQAAPVGMSAVQGIDLQLVLLAAGQEKGPVTGFAAPVKVQVRLSAEALQGKNVDLLGGYYLDQATGKLDYVGGRYDAASGTFEFTTTHWSKYLILEYKKEFNDLPAGHWAHNDVQVMAARHVVKGVSDTEFAPEASITRAQFAALLVRALGLEPEAKAQPVFADVQPGQWFFAEVMAAYRAGLVQGYSHDKFAPDDPITREQMATMVVRALRRMEKAPPLSGQEVQATLASFGDGNLVSAWASEGMAVAVKAGIVRGRTATTLAPAGLTTRAESAAMLKRFMQAGGLL